MGQALTQDIAEANQRLLTKRAELKVMGNHTQSITSFRDFIPKCIHGVKMDELFNCPECEKHKRERFDAEQYNDWSKNQREEEEKSIEEFKKNCAEHPEGRMDFIPKKFRDKSFETFQGANEVKKILQQYSDSFIYDIRYIGGRSTLNNGLIQYPGSILLIGKTGCGKTHLAVAVVREFVKRAIIRDHRFITAPELLLEIRSTYNSKPSGNSWDGDQCKTEEDVINKYSECEFLILDDLGAEKVSDFAIQSLYLVIDRRNRELKPTIVTTNLTLEEIEDKIDARMASRLSDMKVIKLNMPDYRKKRG